MFKDRPAGTVRHIEVARRLNGRRVKRDDTPNNPSDSTSQPQADGDEGLATALLEPISSVLQPVGVVIPASATLAEARAMFQSAQLGLLEALPVCDGQGYCVGMIVHQDLLVRSPDVEFMRPSRIGGMATPFGVYLTDGSWQAGASNLALVSGGAVTGILLTVAGYTAQFGWQAISQHFGMSSVYRNLDVTELNTSAPLPVALTGFGIKLVIYLIFFVLLRSTNIAGYHAAEHQTVHALERNEPLLPEVVRRMPRPHPRCGTNLMAACLLVFTLSPLLGSLLHVATEDALILSMVVTFFCYRRLGTFLQAVFTTRPASDREIASGIAAAEALAECYYRRPPTRTGWLRRLWCQGLVQNMIGLLLVVGAQGILIWAVERWSQHH